VLTNFLLLVETREKNMNPSSLLHHQLAYLSVSQPLSFMMELLLDISPTC
jgi:hypothetical protein